MKLSCVLLLVLLISGCGEKEQSHLKLALNWYPEAEHGGYFAAEVEGYFKEAELEVAIQSGGPDAPVIQKVATGQAHYGIANADDVLNARVSGADIVALFAPIQINPRCIMVHEGTGVSKISDIKNMTLAMSARPAFSHWLRAQYEFQEVNVVPYPSSIAVFLNNPNFAQQAYNISEPFVAQKMGAKPKVLMVSDLGFNPYCSVLITTAARLKDHPEEVKKMVTASRKGWLTYLGSPLRSHERINRLNPEMPIDVLNFGAEKLFDMTRVEKGMLFGEMTEERWQTLALQMKKAGLIELSSEEIKKAWRNF